jgi:hypothetical protein
MDNNDTNATPYEEEYWASADTRRCGDEVLKRCQDYWTFLQAKGWFTLFRRLYYAYNPNRYSLAQTIQSGESNEYRTIKVNHFRNLLEHIQTLSITDRPAWQPQSTNTDSRSQKQTIIANGVLDYMMREKRVERHLRDATRNALLFTEGFVSEWWDSDSGAAIATDEETNTTKHVGDIRYSSHEPVDVIRDPNLKSFSQRSWVVLRTYENKYDLAAKYPEYAEEIIDQPSGITIKNHYLGGNFLDKSNQSDQIPLLTFYHVKSASCPEGRQMSLLTDGTILVDSILLYKHIPVHRIVSSDQVGTPMGMSVSQDLLPLQEMIDAHYTTILSINENYGIPKILLPIGSQVMADSLSAGFQTISYNPQGGKPEILMMPTAPEGLFKAMIQLQHDMETISGVNSVSRGNPEASLRSGSALALVQSMAIQFHAPLQQSYIQLLEDVGTATIQIMQDYADAPRIIQIAGKRNKGLIQQSFSNKDIDGISRVQVQVGNPLSKTVSGRLSIAQDLLQNKIITNAAEYLMVLETGELEPLTQGPTLDLLNLASENEMLQDGQSIPVLFTDNHVLHIQEHSSIASDPIVRSNPEQFGIIAKHIMEHIQMLSDPDYQNYRMLTNQPSIAPVGAQPGATMPPGTPQAGAPGPAATSLNASGGPTSTNPPSGPNPTNVQQMAGNVKQPQMPVNPLSGKREML